MSSTTTTARTIDHVERDCFAGGGPVPCTCSCALCLEGSHVQAQELARLSRGLRRRPYKRPTLRHLGSVQDMTQGGGSVPIPDGHSGKNKK